MIDRESEIVKEMREKSQVSLLTAQRLYYQDVIGINR
jgi:hypothetical protein